MSNKNELIVIDSEPVSAIALREQVNAIQRAMKDVMIEGTHYGKIPGCGDKPTLLKAGAEKIGLMFRLLPNVEIAREDLPGGHREYTITMTLKAPNGVIVGQGLGSCSTLESKYRWRNAQRICPECGKEAIIKGKNFKTGQPENWLCWAKKDGCGHKFALDDPAITKQEAGRVENTDIADQYNTCLKIAKKRAHVDAILTCTAASDIFTQDVEDTEHFESAPAAPDPATKKNAAPIVKAPESAPNLSATAAAGADFTYSTDNIAPERLEAAVSVLERNGAKYNADLQVWRCARKIPSLARHEIKVAIDKAKGTRRQQPDDLPEEWEIVHDEEN